MTTTYDSRLCRVTVLTLGREIDVAVPAGTPVATLLPLLLEHASPGEPAGARPGGGWVLQRLGEPPFDLSGTPESLDWLEGEELHLRPAEDPLPELDFDDIAEGVANSVKRRDDRWQPEFRRVLFLVLAAVAAGTVAAVLAVGGPVPAQVAGAATLSVTSLTAAVVSGLRLQDKAFGFFFAACGMGFAALAAFIAIGSSLVVSVSTAVLVAVLLIAVQRTVVSGLPLAPLLVVAVTGLLVVLLLLLRAAPGMTVERTSVVAIVVALALLVIVPRAVVKLARLRGPQLPKTGEDMAYDIEPVTAEDVQRRTSDAETYLTAGVLTVSLLLPVLFLGALEAPGWAGWTVVSVAAAAVLLRARTFHGVWQRLGLVAAGTAGCLMTVVRLTGSFGTAGRWTTLLVLIGVAVALLLAALRPWPQRMLPFWEYTATFFDVLTGVAVLPAAAQILGVYAWARGLFG